MFKKIITLFVFILLTVQLSFAAPVMERYKGDSGEYYAVFSVKNNLLDMFSGKEREQYFKEFQNEAFIHGYAAGYIKSFSESIGAMGSGFFLKSLYKIPDTKPTQYVLYFENSQNSSVNMISITLTSPWQYRNSALSRLAI